MANANGSALADKVAEKLRTKAPQPAVQPIEGRTAQGVPNVVEGGLSTSRGFSICKAIARQQNLISAVDAKEEIEACGRFRKALEDTNQIPNAAGEGSIFLPLGSDYLSGQTTAHEGYRYIKSMMDAGMSGYDPDEANWLANRLETRRYRKSQSYLIDNIGGSLVPPPVQGELIELMRPKQACLNAGASTVPLPPNGKIVYPSQTSPSTMYWVDENASITESQIGTGQIPLQAKKGAVFLTLPNELLKYASVAADALFKTDSAKTLALGFDYACLYGTGGAAQPKGLTLFTDTNQVIDYAGQTPAPKGVGTNGNTLRPEDGSRMIGLVEDRNFEFTSWIMRPTLANNVTAYRADAVAAGDAAGAFVNNMMRAFSDKMPGDNWLGYKVSKSAVVKNTQAKGSATNLTDVFGGQFEHMLCGMYGAVEITSSNQAGNTFQKDQTAIRTLIFCDMNLRYPGAFVWMKQVLATN